MIPSRPLSFVELIAETFGIVRRILLRYWLLFALLIAPGGIVLTFGIRTLAQDTVSSIQHGLHYDDSTLTILRDESRASLRKQSPYFAIEEQMLGLSDSASIGLGNGHIAQVRSYLQTVPGWASGLGVIAIGAMLLLVGILTLLAATTDLASMVFEERQQETFGALKSAFRTHLVRLFALHILYWGAIIFIDILITVFSGLSITFAAVFSSFATVFELYVSVRLTAAVPSLVSEELRPIAAISRSWQLTLRSFRILMLWFAFGLVLFIGTLGVSAIGSLLFPNVMEWLEQVLSLRPLTFTWLQSSIPSFIWSLMGEMALFAFLLGPFLPVFFTVLYYDLRTRHDGPLVYID